MRTRNFIAALVLTGTAFMASSCGQVCDEDEVEMNGQCVELEDLQGDDDDNDFEGDDDEDDD
jgi:hypothetical protein